MVPEAMWPAHKVDLRHEGGRKKKIAISDETLAAHKIDPGHKNQQMWPAHTIDLQHVRTTQCGQPIKLTLVMKVEGKIRELSVVGPCQPEAMWPHHKVDLGHKNHPMWHWPAHKVDLDHEGKRRELSLMDLG